jgi:predicted ATPase
VAEENELAIWSAVGACIRGAALVELGEVELGLRLFEEGITEYRWLKSPPIFMPLILYFYARAKIRAGKPAEALALLHETSSIVAREDSNAFTPEFLGLGAELAVQNGKGNVAEAETMLVQAVETARKTEATTMELRAATRLSRFRLAQGNKDEARVVLQTAYDKMTEGFEMQDMREARELLESMA